MASILTGIQKQAADVLRADPFFANIPVLTEDLREIDYLAQKAAEEIGLLVLVTTPSADIRYKDMSTPYFESIRLLVRVIEEVAVNKAQPTYVSAGEAGEAALALLYHQRPEGINEVWNPGNPTLTVREDLETGFVVAEVPFETSGGIAYPVPQLPAPIGVWDGSSITLSCDIPGAAVYYTTDGTYPAPRKVDGTIGNLATDPVMVPVGTTVLAKAWLAGYIASDVYKTVAGQ